MKDDSKSTGWSKHFLLYRVKYSYNSFTLKDDPCSTCRMLFINVWMDLHAVKCIHAVDVLQLIGF